MSQANFFTLSFSFSLQPSILGPIVYELRNNSVRPMRSTNEVRGPDAVDKLLVNHAGFHCRSEVETTYVPGEACNLDCFTPWNGKPHNQ